MSNYYINLYYDPQRQGYDDSSWKTLFGSPTVVANRLNLSNASIVHYADILRGDVTFNLNVPSAPGAGDARTFGLLQPNRNSYAYFSISNSAFSANTSNGLGDTSSVTIAWESDWTSTNTNFRIKWGAGTVTFYVNNVQRAVVSDASVSGSPMSFYLSNGNSDGLTLGYIDAIGIQSLFMNEGLENQAGQFNIYSVESLDIDESNSGVGTLANITPNESVSIAENTSEVSSLADIDGGEDLSITEDTSVSEPA